MIYPFPSGVEVRDASGNLKCVTTSEFIYWLHFHNLLEVSILLSAKRVNAKSKAINEERGLLLNK